MFLPRNNILQVMFGHSFSIPLRISLALAERTCSAPRAKMHTYSFACMSHGGKGLKHRANSVRQFHGAKAHLGLTSFVLVAFHKNDPPSRKPLPDLLGQLGVKKSQPRPWIAASMIQLWHCVRILLADSALD